MAKCGRRNRCGEFRFRRLGAFGEVPARYLVEHQDLGLIGEVRASSISWRWEYRGTGAGKWTTYPRPVKTCQVTRVDAAKKLLALREGRYD